MQESSDIVKREKALVKLDFTEVFIRREGGQVLAPFSADVPLSEKKGHLYEVGGKYRITADGYIHCNKISSVSLVTPRSVIVDGEERPNPYVERNPKSKMIESVIVRKIGIGFTPVGNLMIIDNTLFYHIYSYFIQSIQAKMKKKKWDKKTNSYSEEPLYKDFAKIGVSSDDYSGQEGTWAFLATAEPFGLWINYENPAFQDVLEEHTQRMKFADRIAQKIVTRNILADHPAIGVRSVDVDIKKENGKKVDATTSVKIYGFKNSLTSDDIGEVKEKAEKGEEIKLKNGPVVDIKKEEIKDVDPEEEAEIVKAEAEEEEGRLFNMGGDK